MKQGQYISVWIEYRSSEVVLYSTSNGCYTRRSLDKLPKISHWLSKMWELRRNKGLSFRPFGGNAFGIVIEKEVS